MVIADLIRRGRLFVPSFLFERNFYLESSAGKPNGSSIILDFCDCETDDIVYSLHLPYQYIQDLIMEYMLAQLRELKLDKSEGYSFDEIASELASFNKSEYTEKLDFIPKGQINEEDSPNGQEPIRQRPQLRAPRVVDQPLQARAYRIYGDLARWPAAQENQPLPNGGAGNALGGAAADVAGAIGFNAPANEANVPAGWDAPLRRDGQL